MADAARSVALWLCVLVGQNRFRGPPRPPVSAQLHTRLCGSTLRDVHLFGVRSVGNVRTNREATTYSRPVAAQQRVASCTRDEYTVTRAWDLFKAKRLL